VARQCLKTSIYAFRACIGTLLDSAIEFTIRKRKKKKGRYNAHGPGAFMLNVVKLKSNKY
jgi:hypothetical protein